MSDPIADPVRFIDERTASAPLLRKAMRYLFPDHWSFLLGEVALYSFMVLIATGIYLALFYDPSTAKTIYHGPYAPLDGQIMSAAYKSVVDLSLSDKAGLLMRQTHHWAADVFMVSIVMHLMRVFFTGAFRKPRELTWLVGLLLLFTALLEGYLGYSLVDDLLSGIGLAIGYGVGLSIPVIGGPLTQGIFGAPFPGKDVFFSRMYIAHVLLIPLLLATLIGIHLALIAARHHTQFKESKRTTQKRIVGVPMFPGQTAALAGAHVLHRRDPVPARRPGPDQPDLAMGAVRAVAGHQRRPARLVSRLADRGVAADAELRRHDRALHRHTEPVLGRCALPIVRGRGAGCVPVARAPCQRRSTRP